MTTNFFQSLAAVTQADCEWVIVIKQTALQHMTVSVLYKNDNCGDPARSIIPPLTFAQPPQVLDEHFFNDLNAAIPETAQLFNSMEHYLKQREDAKAKAASNKPEKQKPQKQKSDAEEAEAEEDEDTDVPKKTDRERKYEAAMQKALELEKAGKPREAWMKVPEPSDYPEHADTIRARRRELSAQFEQASLFNT